MYQLAYAIIAEKTTLFFGAPAAGLKRSIFPWCNVFTTFCQVGSTLTHLCVIHNCNTTTHLWNTYWYLAVWCPRWQESRHAQPRRDSSRSTGKAPYSLAQHAEHTSGFLATGRKDYSEVLLIKVLIIKKINKRSWCDITF